MAESLPCQLKADGKGRTVVTLKRRIDRNQAVLQATRAFEDIVVARSIVALAADLDATQTQASREFGLA